MPINVDFLGLETALNQIGGRKADIGKLRSTHIIENPIELQIIKEGMFLLTGAQLKEQLSKDAGLLSIGNTQVTLHIYHPFENKESLSQVPAYKPKFHLTECTTLINMYRSGRANRYVSAIRRDGKFQVQPYDDVTKTRGEDMDATLLPCHFCLMALNYNGYKNSDYQTQDRIKKNFSLEKFFEECKFIFRCLPLYTPETFPEGNYTKEWGKISREVRVRTKWTCTCCNVNCKTSTKLLHVHHKDGNRGNNRSSNLEVVCLACHKTRPFHQGMHYSRSDRMELESLRESQGLPKHCAKCNI